MSNRIIRISAIIGILIVIALLIYFQAKPDSPEGPAAVAGNTQAAGPAAPLPVKVIIARDTTMSQSIAATGTMLPNESVELKNEVAGRVEKIYFEEGSRVKAGQVLLKIDDAEWQAQLAKLNHQIKLAEENESRERRLVEKDAISREAYTQTLTELNVRRAERDVLLTQIGKTVVRAPFSGTIGLRQVSPGSYLAPGTLIARMVSTDPMKIEFAVPGKYASSIKEGQKLRFTSGEDAATYTAEVYAVEPVIDLNTRSINVRAKVPNANGQHKAGTFVNVELISGKSEKAITVPSEAIIPGQTGQSVYLLKDGKVEARAIVTGTRTAGQVQVLEGLSSGDTVLTTGLLQVRPGMPVQPQITTQQ